jgi:patatin-related protein
LFLREKELRIALVCFGGVSLAVYMHGICKEILKLVRASSALHRITDRSRRAKAAFFDQADPSDPEYDTESDYFELLQKIGHKIELRVIVDILAGASAGGINATMLARALSHDLPTLRLRDLWLDNADVTVLLAPEARAGRWSKWILKPLIWGAAATGLFDAVRDNEVRRKLSVFLRSRWFKPPFYGLGMAGLMYDAAAAMGDPKTPTASLLPTGQGLDLFVTLTDYYGYQQLLPIHDPPFVYELEHRHVLHFMYRRRPNGEVESDFDLENVPAVAFAARATSSFPGAFPPAQLVEMDELVASRGVKWLRRKQFIMRNFERYLRANVDPATAAFIDGAVLNNRPFREAISAIHGRPAYRDVDRRLVYIDANPASVASSTHSELPGFFSTLKGALSDLPSAQPIANELAWVINLNAQVRAIKSIIEGARPHINELVGNIIDKLLDRRFTADEIRGWREEVNARVARDAGFAHEGYARLKLASVQQFVARMFVKIGGRPLNSPLARAIEEVVNAWAVDRGIVYKKAESEVLKRESAEVSQLPPWVEFFLTFDVDYRKRRLHFLIEGQNRLYRLLDAADVFHRVILEVDELLRAEVGHRLTVGGASGADHVGAGLTCELRHHRPDCAGRAVHEDALPRLKAAVLEQSLPRGQARDRQARAHREVDVARQRREVACLDRHILGQRAVAMPVREAEHPLSHRQPPRAIAKGGDHSSQLVPGDRRCSVTVEAIGPGRGPRQLSRDESRRINLNDDVVYRCLRLGPLHQLHSGRSRSLVRYHDCLHGNFLLGHLSLC